MSDEEPPRKIRRKMERIFICNEVWFDCLPFLSRAKVGLAFALVSDRFDGLADAHLGSKKRPWKLGRMRIEEKDYFASKRQTDQRDAIIEKNYMQDGFKILPLPDGPLPENAIGFKRINIFYVDHKVIDFLRRIRQVFQSTNNCDGGIGLEVIPSSQARSWDVFCDSIWPLLNPSAIAKLYFLDDNAFEQMRQRISPTFLTDWPNVRLVDFYLAIGFEDGENGQLLRDWLHTPREDGTPKLLKLFRAKNSNMVELKAAFLSAETAAISFIISMEYYGDDVVPFVLDNWRTGERLECRKVEHVNINWLLERGPIEGRNVEQWAKWEEEVTKNGQEHNFLSFYFCDDNIGPLSPPPAKKMKKCDEETN